jgi:Thymidylate synthase
MDFPREIFRIQNEFESASELVHTDTWQGVNISNKPEMATHELRHVFMRVRLISEELDFYRSQIQPNLPWADDHFLERVCGQPINPGVQWAHWPWGNSAKGFLKDGKFNHNYMERYFPKFAGTIGPTTLPHEFAKRFFAMYGDDPASAINRGIYHPYGDLHDVVKQLRDHPNTRQAILPVFFPEDTGAVHGGRVPCTLAYQFLMRNNRLDVSYWIRSCDFRRHFRDDIYLTVRLLLWVLTRLREFDASWNDVMPGEYVMLISSLHLFRNDYLQMFGASK